jgi:hypothetical protein
MYQGQVHIEEAKGGEGDLSLGGNVKSELCLKSLNLNRPKVQSFQRIY